MTLRLPELPSDPHAPFPPVDTALADPDGLLAFGGDLSPVRFLNAYRSGIFPWFSAGEPILWWSPSRRAVFRSDGVSLPSKLRRRLRNSGWTVRADTAFAQVVAGCAAPRRGQSGGTWITAGMVEAYNALHRLGHAHSIEVFDGGRLVGGVFGLSFYEQNRDTLKVATVSGVTPSLESVAKGEYPVSRPLFFYVKKQHIGAIQGLKEFTEFFVSDELAGPEGPLAAYGLVSDPELAATQTAVADEATIAQ